MGKADQPQHLLGLVPRLLPRHRLVQLQRLLDLVADRVDRRQRGHRFLEDHRDATAAQRAHLAAVGIERRDVDRARRTVPRIAEQDAPAGDLADPRQDAEYRLTHDRFAGA
jgi:hypothetical protein